MDYGIFEKDGQKILRDKKPERPSHAEERAETNRWDRKEKQP